MKKTFIVLVMIILYHGLNAQNIIKGKITDQNNNSLPGATIYLPEINKGIVTDINGDYEITNLPNGKIRIQFSYLGFTNKIETVVLSGSTVKLNIILWVLNNILENDKKISHLNICRGRACPCPKLLAPVQNIL